MDGVPTDSAEVEIRSGGKIWSNHPVTKSVGVLQGAPSFGSVIPPEVERSIAPFFRDGDDSSHSIASGSNSKGSFRVFSKDLAHRPDDIGCCAAETVIGMILEDPAAHAFGKEFCRNLVQR